MNPPLRTAKDRDAVIAGWLMAQSMSLPAIMRPMYQRKRMWNLMQQLLGDRTGDIGGYSDDLSGGKRDSLLPI